MFNLTNKSRHDDLSKRRLVQYLPVNIE